jgi:hypothetical protein
MRGRDQPYFTGERFVRRRVGLQLLAARPTAMRPQGPLESPWRPFFFQIRNRFLFICNPRYDRLCAREGNQISNHGSSCARDIF